MKLKIPHIPLSVLLILFLAVSCGRHEKEKPTGVAYYTCSMHPSVRSEDPDGKCPVCGMDLVPVMVQTNSPAKPAEPEAPPHAAEFNIPTRRQQLIGVTYDTVETRPLQSTLRALGVVTYDPLRRWVYVSRVEGYVQELNVSSPGQRVEKARPLLTLYSPDLLVAEREFVDLLRNLDAARASGLESAIESVQRDILASRRRLNFWNINDAEIDNVEKTRRPSEYLTLYSPFEGIVRTVPAGQGSRVSAGDPLVEVVDLSAVWVWADFYQEDLSLLTNGLPVTITNPTDPGWRADGTIAAIDPFLDPAKRACRARVELANPGLKLRPEMYVNVQAHLDFGCGLAVPAGAVLPVGERDFVFVDKGGGSLEPRVVELGRKCGEFYAVRKGLAAGERVAGSAVFLIDAEAQVQGAISAW